MGTGEEVHRTGTAFRYYVRSDRLVRTMVFNYMQTGRSGAKKTTDSSYSKFYSFHMCFFFHNRKDICVEV